MRQPPSPQGRSARHDLRGTGFGFSKSSGGRLARLPAAALMIVAAAGYSVASAAPHTIFINGRIVTPNGVMQAMAVEGPRIVAIGDDARIRRSAKADATVVDLKGAAVLPGLFDMHVHPRDAGFAALQCVLDPGASARRLLEDVRQCVLRKKPGEWVIGRAWQAGSMGAVPIDSATLDAVSPDNPVVLTDTSGHSRWINSAALRIAGITAATPDPTGGIIERNGKGEPTGVLRENARMLILDKIPRYTRKDSEAALKRALNRMLSQGVTSFNDAKLLRADLIAYGDLSDRGRLKQHVLGCLAYRIAPDFERLMIDRQSFARPNFRPACVKVWVDGVPTEGHTGAMIEPYADAAEQSNAPPKGLPLIPQPELDAAVTRWDRMGLTVKFHVAGDGAVRAAMDAIAVARAANGDKGPRHMLAHDSFVAAEDVGRAKRLNATYEFGPYIWYPSPISADVAKAVGPARMARAWPVREALESGALVVAGSDWPIVADPSPWIGIETLVTRRRPGGGGASLAPSERVTVKQAFDMYTINAARQLGVERDRGSLEVGKIADLVVVDHSPFDIPETSISSIKVKSTYIDGEEVFSSG